MDLTSFYNQTAVYWAMGAPDGFGGYAYETAVEITCRWDDKQELFLDANGVQQLSAAIVFPDQAVALEGFLYLGAESTLDSDHSDPETISAARKIRQAGSYPGVDAEGTLYQAWL